MSIEIFGYGFGFVGVILLMMQEIALGKYQSAPYGSDNSLMNLFRIAPGAISGKIQPALGYRSFFVWALISAGPALLLARLVPIHPPAVPELDLEPDHV